MITAKNQNKVPIIDDHNANSMPVEQAIEGSGYTTVCANNNRSGLEGAVAVQPDVIILDHWAPEIDGNETLIQLKAEKSTQDIPVTMFIGDHQIADVSTSLELGVVDNKSTEEF